MTQRISLNYTFSHQHRAYNLSQLNITMAAKKYTQCFLNKKVLVHRYVYILIASLPFEKGKEFVLSHSFAVGPIESFIIPIIL